MSRLFALFVMLVWAGSLTAQTNNFWSIGGNPSHGFAFDFQGRIVFQTILTESSSTVNLGDLPDGIYIVKLSNNEQTVSKKIIVQQ